MNIEDAISYLESFTWSASRIGLDREKQLLELLGSPQKKLKFVHVAGTNGKGSTCAMLSSVLQCAGYKTGLFTSPHLHRYNERIKINGTDISDERLAALVERIRPLADGMDEHPSFFELSTAIAFEYCFEENCDIVVLEVGMGGEFDSTNVIDAPECAVISNIGLEHTEYLGNTLEEIAAAKAGIIKRGCPVVCYRSGEEAERVFADKARALGAPLILPDNSSLTCLSSSLSGQIFRYKDSGIFPLPLLGAHQVRNAAVVLEVIKILREHDFQITDEDIKNGLTRVSWPVRFEVLRTEPPVIVDGAHNPQCAQALAETLEKFLPGRQSVFILGMLSDKDRRSVLRFLCPYAESFVCLTPPGSRALPAETLARELTDMGEKAAWASDTLTAAELALRTKKPVVACGSLYMAGEIKKALLTLININRK